MIKPFSIKKISSHSFMWMIIFTICISVILVIVPFAVFINGGAYKTVKQISAGSQALQKGVDGVDTTSPIQSIDIENYSKSLPQKVKIFNDQEDFGPIQL